MENSEEDTVQLHGDDEIIEVIDLNDTEQATTGWCNFTTFNYVTSQMVSGSVHSSEVKHCVSQKGS